MYSGAKIQHSNEICKEKPGNLFLGLYILVIYDGGVGVEVQGFHVIALDAPAPPEEAVTVFVIDGE